jgi:MSHA biogenesis protein MshJ
MNTHALAFRKAALQWWQQRPPRERWMLLGGGIASVLVVIDLGWTAPLEKQARRLETELKSRQETIAKSSQPAAPAQEQEARRLREDEVALRRRVQQAQAARAQVGEQAAGLPELLRTLTGQMGSVRLVTLDLAPDPSTAAAVPSDEQRQASTAAAGAGTTSALASTATAGASAHPTPLPSGQALHRLPLTLKVSGPYADLQRLMSHIEAQAPSLQWTSLTLDGGTWPSVQLTLRAQALSLRPTWGSPS